VRGTVKRVDIDGVEWPVNGAEVVVLDGDRALVQFRPWPPGWELPGGHCEPEETPGETAAREAEEETGYRITVTSLVGVYTWAGLRSAGSAVYLGRIDGGHRRRTIEAWSTRMVGLDHLPRTLFPWYRQRLLDARARARGGPPVHRVQLVTAYHVLNHGTAWILTPIDRWQRRRRSRAR
jgi:8-oxo-dGTP diphosphatase